MAICSKKGGTTISSADFVIDNDRLSKTDYLMALSHGDRHIADAEATETIYGIVLDITFHWWSFHELSQEYLPRRHEVMAASDFANVAIALYYLEKWTMKMSCRLSGRGRVTCSAG